MSEKAISEEQVNFFHENGYLVIDDFVASKNVLDGLRERMSQLIKENFDPVKHQTKFVCSDDSHVQDVYFLDSSDKISYFVEENKSAAVDTTQGKFYMNKVGHALHEDTVFRDFSFDPRVKSITKKLTGFAEPTIVQSMYIFKPPLIGGEVTPHRDATFIITKEKPCIGFWFPLEDATIKNGCLWGVPGSHKWGISSQWVRSCRDNRENKMSFANFLDEKEMAEYKKRDLEAKYVPIEMKAGSVILLHGHFLHKSLKNESDRSREAYTFHIVDFADYDQEKNWLLRDDNYPQFWEGN